MFAATCADRFDIAGTTGTNCTISPSGFTVYPWAASAARNSGSPTTARCPMPLIARCIRSICAESMPRHFPAAGTLAFTCRCRCRCGSPPREV